MKKRPVPYAIFGAVVCGLVGIVSFYVYTQDQQAQMQAHDQALSQKFEKELSERLQADRDSFRPLTVNVSPAGATRQVLYARQDIDADIPLTQDMFEAKKTPADLLKQAFTTDEGDLVRRSYSLRPIKAGDPLTETNVGINAPRLADRIPVGFKAMTIPALSGDGNLTGGFLQDGDSVDLLLTHPEDPIDPKSPVACDAVIQALPVLYVPGTDKHSEKLDGINPSNTPGAPVAVTVQVTLQEAQILSLLQTVPGGKFEMILRAHNDGGISKDHTYTQEWISDNMTTLQNTVDKTVMRAAGAQIKVLQVKNAGLVVPAVAAPTENR